MLLKEYSLDPELFSQPALIKGFVRDFSLDKGRVLSVVPKNWFRLVYDNLNTVSDPNARKQAEILALTLNKWKMQRIAMRSPARKDAEYHDPWIEYVDSFEQDPFDGVLTLKNLDNAISPEDIWQEPEGWQVASGVTTEITIDKIFQHLERAFTLSEEIYVIDPYFNLEDSKYWPFWEALAATMKRHQHLKKLVIVTADHKAPIQILGRNEDKLKQVRNCEIWQVAKDKIEGGFHDRFILTDFVGFSFSNSFQEKPNEFMEITRLTTQSYEQRKAQYLDDLKQYQQIH